MEDKFSLLFPDEETKKKMLESELQSDNPEDDPEAKSVFFLEIITTQTSKDHPARFHPPAAKLTKPAHPHRHEWLKKPP